jgi:hypothetical protein
MEHIPLSSDKGMVLKYDFVMGRAVQQLGV